jgi:polyhydroxyalkanoate synthase
MQSNPVFEQLKDFNEKFIDVLYQLNQSAENKTQSYCKRESVLEINKLTLYHYAAISEPKFKTPILIVYALVNRPTILDLQKNHSAIEKLLEAGHEVYLIDWGYPEQSDSHLGLSDYIHEQLHTCVEYICDTHQIDKINLFGVCQGGVLSLCYSSLYADNVKNLTLAVTPVDFQTKDDQLSQWVRYIDINLMVDTLGNIPGNMLSNTFLSLKPFRLQIKKYLDLVNNHQASSADKEKLDNFISMEEWIFDSPDLAGEMFREFIIGCYQKNQLIKGELKISKKHIDLSKLKMPILNVYAKKDHLVPPAASKALKTVITTNDYQEIISPGGHIGLFVSPKSLDSVFPQISQWFAQRD